MDQKIDILAVGELLIDFISTEFADDFSKATNFKRLPGGSPANLAMNMKRLGNEVVLLATVGQDDMGQYLKSYCAEMGLTTDAIHQVQQPTTLILVTRSQNVSNFEAYRGADTQILPTSFSPALLENCRIFHTTCFALSQSPARDSILTAAQQATQAGAQLSIDANYAQKIWPDQEQAQSIVAQYCQMGALVKVSEVDWERLYGTPLQDPKAAIQHFLSLGAREVCVTLGGDGCWLGTPTEKLFLEARPVEVKDTTGAGDAFWSGYLTAWLDDKPLSEKAQAARAMAELKIGHFGPLPKIVGRELIYTD